MDIPPDAAPAALADLIAAGLVSHELISDPGQLGAEAPALAALCGLVAGSVYRIEPFHYAFRAEAGDLAGGLAELAAEDWTGALEAALKAALGLDPESDAVWLGAIETALAEPRENAEGAPLDAPLLLLRAQDASVGGAVAAARIAAPEAGLQAVIQARYAAETARLTARSLAAAEPGTALARRLAAIELRQEEILARLAEMAPALGPDPLLMRLNEGLGGILDRLERHEARAGDLAEHLAEHLTVHLSEQLSELLGRLLAERPVPAAFEETIGLSLAEFLAQLERRDAEAATPRPRLS